MKLPSKALGVILATAVASGCTPMQAMDNLNSIKDGAVDLGNGAVDLGKEWVVDPVNKTVVQPLKSGTSKKIEEYGEKNCGGSDKVSAAGSTLLCAPEHK